MMARLLSKAPKSRLDSGIGALSPFLTSRGALVAWFLCAFISNRFGLSLLAAFAFLFGLLGTFARLWGYFALHHVRAEMDSLHRTLSVGEAINIRCRIRNDKFLPLIWLEFCLPVPPRDCLAPDGGFTRYDEVTEQDNEQPPKPVYRRRMALLLWYRIAEWDSMWMARRRGIYQPGEVQLRAGDGFGLTQSERRFSIPGEPTFVVYPRLVPVSTDDLLRTVWMGETGARGYLEDPAVLRGERGYQIGDSWKRIDWRMAARNDDLQVKIYETILPRSIHFVLDVASFAAPSQENIELEDALSVLASLLLRLDGDGVRCGLSLPHTDAAPNWDMFPDDLSLGVNDLLFHLAALEEDGATDLFSENLIAALQHQAGQICFVTRGGGRATCGTLLERLELQALTVLTLYDPSGVELWAGCRILRMEDIIGMGARF